MTDDMIEVGDQRIGPSARPFVVAEMSGNHNQSLDRALAILEAAAATGVQALKLQTYTADTMTLNVDREEFYIHSEDNPWTGRNLYQLYAEAHTPWEWHETLFRRGRELGMLVFSTPFDETAVDFLEELDAPLYKIASFENNHLPLIRKVAATGKPMVMSTGMASLAELDLAVRTAREGGCRELVLLKCTSSYPASPDNSNIMTIPHMRDLFRCQVGLSDHTLGVGAAVASVALGATFIEKHFTLDRSEGGVDADFSLEPVEMKELVDETEQAWRALGTISYGPSEAERGSSAFRRSLYLASDCAAGHVLGQQDVRIIRPSYGLPPSALDDIIGLRLSRAAKRGEPVTWSLFRASPGEDVE